MTAMRGEAMTPAVGDLLHLQQRAFAAATREALGFTIVNETSVLAPLRQAAFFAVQATGGLKLSNASGLVSVAEDTPYTVWLSRLARSIDPQPGLRSMNIRSAPPELADGWQEWLPSHLLACNLCTADGARQGLVLYARELPWNDTELALLARIHETYAYCLQALARAPATWPARAARLLQRSSLKWAGLAVVAALFVPVRMSALAPAEVSALNAQAIASPQDGVVGAFHVRPNSLVKAGEKLFSLDDRGIDSRRDVAEKALAIARADLLSAQQRAFTDSKGKADLASAIGRVREKEAELDLVEGTLDRVTVRAPADGVAVFGDPNDWMGRPVQTGERIMQLADPRDAGVLVWLSVADAINLEPGAPVRLFLHTQPLSPLSATVIEASYQPAQSPAGVPSYRVRARFDAAQADARIGLTGTARISGDWTVLGYYLLRRPISALREWSGL